MPEEAAASATPAHQTSSPVPTQESPNSEQQGSLAVSSSSPTSLIKAPSAINSDEPPLVSKGPNELAQYGHLLFISCLAYLLLAGSSTFVPATIMTAVSEELGMSLAYLGALNSAGAGMKAVLIMFLMGPALEEIGPSLVINVCIVGSGLCNIALALVSSSTSYSLIFMLNYVFNSFSEQPAFIVLYATYFDQYLGVASTCVASAFSLAGFVLPLILSPVLECCGYRTLWNMLAVATLSTAPICFWLLKSGPISLKGALPSFLSLGGSLRVVAFGAKMKRAIRRRQDEGEARPRNRFTGGRLAHHSVVLCDTDLTLAALAKDDAPAGTPSAPSSTSASPSAAAPGLAAPRPNVTFAEAVMMAKFWALMVAAVSFFLYGGQLNLHLPSILVAEVGMGPTEAASIYSIYNVSAVIGKVLTAFVFTIPSLKRSFLIYIPFPLMFTLSHMLILNFDLSARLETGSVLAALSVTDSTPRLVAFCVSAGLGYGFGASIMALLVKEFFGLVELTKLQPTQYACVIFGNMGGMFLPGYLKDVAGTYCASLLMSLCATTLTFACFVVMYFVHPIGEHGAKPREAELV